jgi:L-fucose mutarotase
MLKGIHPLLTPELIGVLASMGHGDDLAVVDANFPATSTAMETAHGRVLQLAGASGRVLQLAGASVPEATAAILSLLPLDSFVEHPAVRMEVEGAPDELPPVQQEIQAAVDAAEGRHLPLGALGRHEFYAAARRCYAVVQTTERRWWADVLLKKGAIAPRGAG